MHCRLHASGEKKSRASVFVNLSHIAALEDIGVAMMGKVILSNGKEYSIERADFDQLIATVEPLRSNDVT
jgi:hypothetical protein